MKLPACSRLYASHSDPPSSPQANPSTYSFLEFAKCDGVKKKTSNVTSVCSVSCQAKHVQH